MSKGTQAAAELRWDGWVMRGLEKGGSKEKPKRVLLELKAKAKGHLGTGGQDQETTKWLDIAAVHQYLKVHKERTDSSCVSRKSRTRKYRHSLFNYGLTPDHSRCP